MARISRPASTRLRPGEKPTRLLCAAAVAVLGWGWANAAPTNPADIIQACAARSDEGAVRGADKLAAQCPGLAAALTESTFAEMLPSGWQERLNRRELQDLAALAARYQHTPSPHVPDTRALRSVLEELAGEREQIPKSWWESVEDWLRSWTANRGERDFSWFDRWLQQLHSVSGVLKTLTYALAGLVVGAALYLFYAELRAAGFLSRANRAAGRSAAVPYRSPFGSGAPAALEQAPLVDRPAILLALLVRSLKRRGRLRNARQLTHRELIRKAALDDVRQHDQFARVAEIAEGVLYSGAAPPSPALQDAVEGGIELLRQLDAAPGPTP